MPMTDAERVLHALLHDLRTPIGVAQGYLRMIQDGRMAAPEDQERALAKALKALNHTARLCENASDFVGTGSDRASVTRVSAAAFASQVEARARDQGMCVESTTIRPNATLAVRGSVNGVCDAIVMVISSLGGSKRASATMHMRADGNELKFIAADKARLAGLQAPIPAPVDHWWSHGLAMAAACRRIVRSSGKILSFEADEALMVAFPLETHPV
jgi:signal transduction histidine kinase